MKYEDFISTFKKQVFELEYNRQVTLAIAVCKKLYFDYFNFFEKYNFGNPEMILDAITLCENAKNGNADNISIEKMLKEVEGILPDMDDYNSDEMASYALNAGAAVASTLEFLIKKESKLIYDTGTCLTDTIYIRIQEDKDLTEIQMDEHPLMVEARDFLIEQSK